MSAAEIRANRANGSRAVRGALACVVGATALVLLALPFVAGNYVLSIATLILYLAYTGQAWNVMMGFAGQLSLGHSLYVGVGAYVAAGLFEHFGVGPWAGVWCATAAAALAGAVIAFLAFRLGVSGVHLSLLTIAFAEFTRIAFDHIDALGGPAGLFLKVAQRDQVDLLNFRGPPAMYYYSMLALAGGALVLCTWLLRRRPGYYWRAIREDEAAAQALGINTFRWKMLAVILSAAMTAPAGVFLAFYHNSLFPEQIFGFGRSIEIILGPVIGGLGSLGGPIVGAAALVLLGDGITEILARSGWDMPGLKHVVYGVLLLAVVSYLPNGIWPPISRALSARLVRG
jgi:branched-chain amino acid transport system permease protein